MADLAHNLKAAIKAKDLTTSQVARRCEISTKTLWQWLNGSLPRDTYSLRKVCQFLGLTLDQALGKPTLKLSDNLTQGVLSDHSGTNEVVIKKVKF